MSDRAVVNLDDERGRSLAASGLPTITYGLAPDADVRATEVESTAEGIAFLADGVPVRSALRGSFNVENAWPRSRPLGRSGSTTASRPTRSRPCAASPAASRRSRWDRGSW